MDAILSVLRFSAVTELKIDIEHVVYGLRDVALHLHNTGKRDGRLRLETARRRLHESNASLESVAATCGFRNCDAMRETFKRVLRVAPGEYRWRFQATQS